MPYRIKELFYTLQGEGSNAGRAAVFCRFSGCNLWSGQERDRPTATCQFCDTDFVGVDGEGGGIFDSAAGLAGAAWQLWPQASGRPLVVCTGGEPLLQLDESLVHAFHQVGFEVAIETNGTQLPPPGIDHICVSPKAGAPLKLRHGQDLKLVYPQTGIDPHELATLDFNRFYLQPKDGPSRDENLRLTLTYCLSHPQWHLSLQTHKIVGIP